MTTSLTSSRTARASVKGRRIGACTGVILASTLSSTLMIAAPTAATESSRARIDGHQSVTHPQGGSTRQDRATREAPDNMPEPTGAKLVSRRAVPANFVDTTDSGFLTGYWRSNRVYYAFYRFGRLQAWNVLTGRMWNWRLQCPANGVISEVGWNVVASPSTVFVSGHCLVTDPVGLQPNQFVTRVAAYSLATGKRIWTRDLDGGEARSGTPNFTPTGVLAANDRWLVLARSWYETGLPALVLRADTGEVTDVEFTGNCPGELRVDLWRDILAINACGTLYGVSLPSGDLLWSKEETWLGYRPQVFIVTQDVPPLGDGLYVTSDGEVLDIRTGETTSSGLRSPWFVDPFGSALSAAGQIYSRNFSQPLWRLYNADVVGLCAGRVWDSQGRVHSLLDGSLTTSKKETPPAQCMSTTRTFYYVNRTIKGTTKRYAEVYHYGRR